MPRMRKTGAGGPAVSCRRLHTAPGERIACTGRAGPAVATLGRQTAAPSRLLRPPPRMGTGSPENAKAATICTGAGRVRGPGPCAGASTWGANTASHDGAAGARRGASSHTGENGRSDGGLDGSMSAPARRYGRDAAVAITTPATIATAVGCPPAPSLSKGGATQ